jgi:uroporphyrin-III C-methyltransferase
MESKKIIGSVTLVGAGPGDPELLTVKAVKALQAATVVLVDDLVSQEVIALADRARIISVGKRGGCLSTPQEFIEKLLIKEAQEGEQVVRLKGGDPFIFGRGGEEVEALQAAGISVVVINGITAGIAAPTGILVPLTHRNSAQGVMFITGHARPHAQDPHWKSIGRCAREASITLVIYMGIKAVNEIQSGLLQSLTENTPAAVIENATTAQQRQVICNLANLSATITEEKIRSPSIIIIGNVVRAQAVITFENKRMSADSNNNCSNENIETPL